MKLKDKIAIVTGGGRGIGRGITMRFVKEGAHVVICDIDMENARKTDREIKEVYHNYKGYTYNLDVTSEQDIEAMVEKVVNDFGHIDILVNNAGVLAITPVVDITSEEWDRVLSVNLKGPFLCAKHVAREMIKRNEGKIINIASNAGKRGDILIAHYSASKFGVIGLSQVLAKELGPKGIHVNAVCPGFIDTEMFGVLDAAFGKYLGKTPEENRRDFQELVPLGRMGNPDDVGAVVAFLASDDADYIQGQAINVCGGVTPY